MRTTNRPATLVRASLPPARMTLPPRPDLEKTMRMYLWECCECAAMGQPRQVLQADTEAQAVDRAYREGWLMGRDGWHCPQHVPAGLLVVGGCPTRTTQPGQPTRHSRITCRALDSQGQPMLPPWREFDSRAEFVAAMRHLGYALVMRLSALVDDCTGVYQRVE